MVHVRSCGYNILVFVNSFETIEIPKFTHEVQFIRRLSSFTGCGTGNHPRARRIIVIAEHAIIEFKTKSVSRVLTQS